MWWLARTGSHKGPIPTSTSSPAPTIHALGGSIRRIVGASGERMRWVGHMLDKSALYSGCPSSVQSTPISLFEMYCPQGMPYKSHIYLKSCYSGNILRQVSARGKD